MTLILIRRSGSMPRSWGQCVVTSQTVSSTQVSYYRNHMTPSSLVIVLHKLIIISRVAWMGLTHVMLAPKFCGLSVQNECIPSISFCTLHPPGWKGFVVTIRASGRACGCQTCRTHISVQSYLRNGMADWHGTEGMPVDRMLDPCCDFQRYPHPWHWTWNFKVKFLNSRI